MFATLFHPGDGLLDNLPGQGGAGQLLDFAEAQELTATVLGHHEHDSEVLRVLNFLPATLFNGLGSGLGGGQLLGFHNFLFFC